MVALGLTVLGYAWPVPYAGYAFSLMWFVPAAVLEGLAIADSSDRRSRVGGLVLLVATGVGVVLGVLGATDYALKFDRGILSLVPVAVLTAVFSLLAAVAGRRRRRHVWET
jgi:hypothetical protein